MTQGRGPRFQPEHDGPTRMRKKHNFALFSHSFSVKKTHLFLVQKRAFPLKNVFPEIARNLFQKHPPHTFCKDRYSGFRRPPCLALVPASFCRGGEKTSISFISTYYTARATLRRVQDAKNRKIMLPIRTTKKRRTFPKGAVRRLKAHA